MIEIIKPNTQFNSYNTTAGSEVVNLVATIGKEYELKNTGTGGNTLTVNYGADSLILQDGETSSFTFDGDEWATFSQQGVTGAEINSAVATQLATTIPKNITEGYENLVQDPTDLTTANWTMYNGLIAEATDMYGMASP